MFNKMLTAVLASTAFVSAPLLAAPGGGHGPANANAKAGGNAGASAGANVGGPAGAALDARMNSMGPANASPTGIDHANPNSVLSTNGSTATTTTTTTRSSARAMDSMFPGTKGSTHVKSGTLTGVTTGTTLTSNGTTVGTVQQIRTSADGTVRVVVVQGTNGQMYAIPANKLTFANGTLTTTARLNGVNGRTAFTNPAVGVSQGPAHASATGIAHASSHSVLAGGAVASSALPGLTTGLTVQTSTGTTLGTVSNVVTGKDGSIRLVMVTSSTGQTYRLSPTGLTINGGVVTTTQIGG